MMRTLALAGCVASAAGVAAGQQYDLGAVPQVAEGFKVAIVAKEPMLLHPSALCFDAKGRLFVGGGPQFRVPTKETPPDEIKILVDRDGDGVADEARVFATGFNSIQAMAWKGRDLYVANAPDLTVVRDLDGDDEADEYVLVYTGLGHLRHGLHGFNFAPDGKLYMSQGDSQVQGHAPKPFRDLHHVKATPGAPDVQEPKVFKKGEYKHSFIDKWPSGEGGILRCDDLGRNLEIYARGKRNPWDIGYSDTFDWVATDNDDGPEHDRITNPFFGAHFGKVHAWSYSWEGKDNPATVPASQMFPVANGSGVGVVFYDSEQFPERYRKTFIIGDWQEKLLFVFRPTWDGAHMVGREKLEVLVTAKPKENKSLFRPTDVEVGPDGAVYVAGWGSDYGSKWAGGKKNIGLNEGRVFKIWYGGSPLIAREKWWPAKRGKKVEDWTFAELAEDLGSQIPAWRTNAQEELVRRGEGMKWALHGMLAEKITTQQETWILWTLGRILDRQSGRLLFLMLDDKASLNRRVQVLRIFAHRKDRDLAGVVAAFATSEQPRVRFEAAQTLRQIGSEADAKHLIEAAAGETDRLCFYAQWRALGELLPEEKLFGLLKDSRAPVRRAGLLALMEVDALTEEEVIPFTLDPDPAVARLATLHMSKVSKTGATALTLDPPGGEFREKLAVTLTTAIKEAVLRYTLDGSPVTPQSPKYEGALTLDKETKLNVGLFRGDTKLGSASGTYRRITEEEYRRRLFVEGVKAATKKNYRVVPNGLREGTLVYTDRKFTFTTIPQHLKGATYVRTANDDKAGRSADHLTFSVNHDVTVYVAHDSRIKARPEWMNIGRPGGFVDGGASLKTSDTTFKLFKKDFKAGAVTLGGNFVNGNDARASSMYQVVVTKAGDAARPQYDTKAEQVVALAGDAKRGREIFVKDGGVGCFNCHVVDGKGTAVGPDLADFGLRADRAHAIESILNPSAKIVDGFLQTVVETKDGDQFYGIPRAETARQLTIQQGDGQPVTVEKDRIANRRVLNESAMPSNFNELLSPQDVADVVAWLLTLRKPADGNAPPADEN